MTQYAGIFQALLRDVVEEYDRGDLHAVKMGFDRLRFVYESLIEMEEHKAALAAKRSP